MNKKSFYAIIPANVRYSPINAHAKLLYGELTALCNEKGFCWAGNAYFAGLYEVSTKTIGRWLAELKGQGFIVVKTENYKRKILIGNGIPLDNSVRGVGQICPRGGDKSVLHNNTVNNTNNNTICSSEQTALLDDPSVESKKEDPPEGGYGNTEINALLIGLASECQIDAFTETKLWQRRYGKHLVALYHKIGKEELVARLNRILEDAFLFKRANSLKFLYQQLKSMPSNRQNKVALSPIQRKLQERRLKTISLPPAK